MNIFQRKYYIYPDLQKPLIKYVILSVVIVSALQSLLIFFSMKWLAMRIGADISVVVDQRVLGPWKNLLYISVFVPILLNFILGFGFILYFSNKFAGPLFRLERELELYLTGEKKELRVQFRENDFLKPLAQKVNKLK